MKYMLLLRFDGAAPRRARPSSPPRWRPGAPSTTRCTPPGQSITAPASTSDPPPPPSARTATVLTDGPFAETKELLFSFYLIDVADLDEATGWAEKMPRRLRLGRGAPAVAMEQDADRGPPPRSPPRWSWRTARSGRRSWRRWPGTSAVTSGWPRTRCRTPSSPPPPMAATGRAHPAGRVAHHHGPTPGHRPAAPGRSAPRTSRRWSTWSGARRATAPNRDDGGPTAERRRRRPPAAHLHLLPPGAGDGGPSPSRCGRSAAWR